MTRTDSAGARFRAALAEESPLQVMGAITAYAGLMAKRTGYKALYLSGGGVAANSLGMPDLGISTMEDVLTDARRIVDATGMPLLVDIDRMHVRRQDERKQRGPGHGAAHGDPPSAGSVRSISAFCRLSASTRSRNLPVRALMVASSLLTADCSASSPADL